MRRCDSAGEFPKAGEIFLTMHIPYSEDGEEIVETCAQASRHTIELALAKDVLLLAPTFVLVHVFLAEIVIDERSVAFGMGASLCICPVNVFPEQQNAMGSLQPVPGTGSGNRFCVRGFAVPGTSSANLIPEPDPGFDGFQQVLKVPGSEGCVPEGSKVSVFDGFRQVRFCSRGLDRTGSGNRVPETRGIKKVPGSGDSVPKVPKVTFYFERALLYFESIDCNLTVNFCTLKVYLCTLKEYFCTRKVNFCTLKVYLCTSNVYFCTLKVQSMLLYFELIFFYFDSILLHFERIP